MKIAIIADIHGNQEALKSVLCQIHHFKVSMLFVLGDIVGYYYHPDAVLNMLKEFDSIIIQGNHERMLQKAMGDKQYLSQITRKYGHGIEMAIDQLDQLKLDMLLELPSEAKFEIDNIKFSLFHGSPWDCDQYIYPDAACSVFEQVAEEESDFVLTAHTHYPFIRNCKTTTLINPGSVGQPRDIGGGFASWVLIDTESKSVIFQRSSFMINKLLKEIKEVDPENSYLSTVLQRRHSFNHPSV
ncbi:MAG: metallophosphoesterase family protein [Pseudomonadota bacterium]